MSASTTNIPVLVLDGGLGTTLEDVFHKDISSPLWSAKPIEDEPEVIIAAHLAFLRAGADVILTSTYQCAYNTFERSGYSREDAKRIMLKSVKLAVEARDLFLEEQRKKNPDAPSTRKVKIALSLGPYGATLYPAQEFDGFYPPPFGPDLSQTTERTNTFAETDDGRAQERAAIDALAQFHYERLIVFATDKEIWNALDFVAFETVPLRREILAIRRAVTQLQNAKNLIPVHTQGDSNHDGPWMKPWWISTVHPDGRYPEMTAAGERVNAVEVAEAVLLNGDQRTEVPWAFGINCTHLGSLPGLLQKVQNVASRTFKLHGRRPWLVLYPNRGDIYHPETQTWSRREKEGLHWAEGLCDVVEKSRLAGVWEGIIAGGCCKTGPDEIATLREKLSS